MVKRKNKTVLLLGCGSGKFGQELIKQYQQNNWDVHCMGSAAPEECTLYKVDWNNITVKQVNNIANSLPELDAVVFAHNGGYAINSDHFKNNTLTEYDLTAWDVSNWVITQMPAYLITRLEYKLKKSSKICWLLGWGTVNAPKNDPIWQYIGYGICKTNAFMLMRCIAQVHPSICYAVDPGDIKEENMQSIANSLYNLQQTVSRSDAGKAFNIDLSEIY